MLTYLADTQGRWTFADGVLTFSGEADTAGCNRVADQVDETGRQLGEATEAFNNARPRRPPSPVEPPASTP